MASIYQNSFLTLAATKSANGDGGCFSTDSPLNYDFLLSTGQQSRAVYVREKLPHWNTLGDNELPAKYPLLTRRWAYQERLLAPRVLHFCERELVWECLEDSFCECQSFQPITRPKVEHFAALRTIRSISNPHQGDIDQGENLDLEGLPTYDEVALQRVPKEATRHSEVMLNRLKWQWFRWKARWSSGQAKEVSKKSGDEIEEELRAAHERQLGIIKENQELELGRARQAVEAARSVALMKLKWHEIVRDYSKLSLTIKSDRLPAIAGLAREAARCRIGSYLAGLWKDSLLSDLMWRVDSLVPPCHHGRPVVYRAPSWSWASVDGGASYREEYPGNAFSDLHLTKAECTPIPGADSFGELAHGYLEVEGQLLRANLQYAFLDNGDLDPRYYKLGLADKVVTLYADFCLCNDCLCARWRDPPLKNHSEVYCLRVSSDGRTTIHWC